MCSNHTCSKEVIFLFVVLPPSTLNYMNKAMASSLKWMDILFCPDMGDLRGIDMEFSLSNFNLTRFCWVTATWQLLYIDGTWWICLLSLKRKKTCRPFFCPLELAFAHSGQEENKRGLQADQEGQNIPKVKKAKMVAPKNWRMCNALEIPRIEHGISSSYVLLLQDSMQMMHDTTSSYPLINTCYGGIPYFVTYIR